MDVTVCFSWPVYERLATIRGQCRAASVLRCRAAACDCDFVGAVPAHGCDPYTGWCVCINSATVGAHCDVCVPGAVRGPAAVACSPCACPADRSNGNCTLGTSSGQPSAWPGSVTIYGDGNVSGTTDCASLMVLLKSWWSTH